MASTCHKPSEDPEDIPPEVGEICDTTVAHDAVFGDLTDEGPNYRNVGWLGTAALMMKTQIGLGVLSIPSAFDTLGLIPGVICLLTIAVITTWSNYIVGVFKLRHREVYGIDDAGRLLFGRLGRETFGVAFCLYLIFSTASGILSVSIGLNAVSSHAVCTAVFVAIAACAGFSLSSIRTLDRISSLAWIGLFCLVSAVTLVTIAVGVQERPYTAPKDTIWVSDYKLTNSPSFAKGAMAVSSLIYAYAGTPAFFGIASEMRDPYLYTRSLLFCQAVVTATYVSIGCVVYYYCGSYVASPALGSAGPVLKKVSYGLALPGLLISTTLLGHLPAKYIFVRILRGSRHLAANTLIHWITWLGCTLGIALVAYIIASAVPVFNGLVSLIGALLGTLMSFQLMGCMWLYDNWDVGKDRRSPKWIFMVAWCVIVIALGSFMMIAGTYGTISDIIESYNAAGGSAAWSCADNSAST